MLLLLGENKMMDKEKSNRKIKKKVSKLDKFSYKSIFLPNLIALRACTVTNLQFLLHNHNTAFTESDYLTALWNIPIGHTRDIIQKQWSDYVTKVPDFL